MKFFLNALSILGLMGLLPVSAQGPNTIPEHPGTPTVRFEQFWEPATPQDFIIIVTNLGVARYSSRNPTHPETQGANPTLPDYHIEFNLSPASQTRIFKLASQANYFDGDFDFKKHPVAATGTKTLTYADPIRHSETTYNWSENTAIDQLTRLFEGISSTLEHGRRLEFLHRYDKLGLEDELKGMEEAAQNHDLAELQAIRPTLETVAGDSSVLNIARQRARRLLDLAARESGESAGVKTPQ